MCVCVRMRSCRYEGEYVDGRQTGHGSMLWSDGRQYDGEWLEDRCHGRGVLTHKNGNRYEGEYKLDKMHGKGVYMWRDGRKYDGGYKNNLMHGDGIWTWPDGVMLSGQWAENLPCRHTCTIIYSSSVSTDEVQPRIGLKFETTMHKLWEDAHAWQINPANVCAVQDATGGPLQVGKFLVCMFFVSASPSLSFIPRHPSLPPCRLYHIRPCP